MRRGGGTVLRDRGGGSGGGWAGVIVVVDGVAATGEEGTTGNMSIAMDRRLPPKNFDDDWGSGSEVNLGFEAVVGGG
jgi:hypothetical protein